MLPHGGEAVGVGGEEVTGTESTKMQGGGVEPTPERPIVTLAEVQRLAEAIDERYRLLVLLAVFGSMRWGELMGLRRGDLDLDEALVRIERSTTEVGTRLVTKSPKTDAGRRVVALPVALVPEVRKHSFAEPGEEGRVFVGPKGATPFRRNFAKLWSRAKDRASVSPELHFHDLRHTGNHFAAASGATTRELMGRKRHASMRAALIYQHRTAERDRAIADALVVLMSAEQLRFGPVGVEISSLEDDTPET